MVSTGLRSARLGQEPAATVAVVEAAAAVLAARQLYQSNHERGYGRWRLWVGPAPVPVRVAAWSSQITAGIKRHQSVGTGEKPVPPVPADRRRRRSSDIASAPAHLSPARVGQSAGHQLSAPRTDGDCDFTSTPHVDGHSSLQQ